MDVFPDMYDMMVAGHVKSGETYEESAVRELAEELGIAGAKPRPLFKYRYDDPTWPSWSTIFDVIWDGPIRHQASEIAWGEFMDEAELITKLDEWPFTPDGVAAFRQHLARRTWLVALSAPNEWRASRETRANRCPNART